MHSITSLRDKFQNKIFNLMCVWMIATLLVGATFAAQPVGKVLATAPGTKICTSTTLFDSAVHDWSNSANWSCVGGGAPTAADDFVVDGPIDISTAQTANSVTISPNGVLTVTAAVKLTVNGDFDVQGIFDDHVTGSTVEFAGTMQTIKTNGYPVDFSNLTKIAAAADTLTIDPGTSGGGGIHTDLLGTMTLKGMSPNYLTLKNGSLGIQWTIQPDGARDIDWVNVTDSNNIDPTAITVAHGLSGGNNLNWLGLTALTTTTTVLTSDYSPANVSAYELPVLLTATVSPAGAVGTVEFKDGTNVIDDCGAEELSGGEASCLVTRPSSGAHTFTATFSGNSAYGPSSTTLAHSVNFATTVTLVSSGSPSIKGSPVTFTATIGPASLVPPAKGKVTFSNESGSLCTAVTVANSMATCTISSMPVGSHNIKAEFMPDPGFDGNMNTINHNVVLQTPDVTLTTSENPVIIGKAVTFTAQLPADAIGVVAFKDGDTVDLCGSVTLDSTGKATCTVSNFKAGHHNITVVYKADVAAVYSSNTSNVVSQLVGLRVIYLPLIGRK